MKITVKFIHETASTGSSERRWLKLHIKLGHQLLKYVFKFYNDV